MNKKPPIQWTIGNAAFNFGVSAKTLSSKLKSAGIKPHFPDATYTTKQIATALYAADEFKLAKARDMRARAGLNERKLAEHEQKLIPADAACSLWEFYLVAAREVIRRSGMSEEEKDSVLTQLKSIPLDDYKHPSP